jgi:hypothetical protein
LRGFFRGVFYGFLVGVFSSFLCFWGVGFVVVLGSFSFGFRCFPVSLGGSFVLRVVFTVILLSFSGLAIIFGRGFSLAMSVFLFSCSRRWRDIFCPLFASFQRDYIFDFRGLIFGFGAGFRSSYRVFVFLFPPLVGYFLSPFFPLSAGYIFNF